MFASPEETGDVKTAVSGDKAVDLVEKKGGFWQRG
jgi:hypothetical protein